MDESQTDRRDMKLMAKLSLPEETEPPWSLLSAGLTVFAMFICLTVIGPALVAIITRGDVNLPSEFTLSWAIGMALTVVFALVSRRSSIESWRALRLARGELPLPLALLVGIAFGLAVDLTVSLSSGAFWPVPQIWYFQARGVQGLLQALLLVVVLQPLAEALVFQAVLLPRMRWSFGPWRGVVATAAAYTVLYGLVFIPPYSFYNVFWHGIIFPVSIGLFFSMLRIYTGSTSAVIIARMGAGLIFLLTALALVGT
ncbi:MAG: CPBP family glutamic-type intramembrane protease [Chloroflexi bacterium]|nr:CPBP family glutamic-type intramembrane protease [Chloroflexota bacterium]